MNLDIIAAMDALLLAAFVVGALVLRRMSLRSGDPARAFAELESSIGKAYPSLPVGYTFREALEKMKSEGFAVNWDRVYGALEGYERSRFGGEAVGGEINSEVLRLARAVARRRRWWKV